MVKTFAVLVAIVLLFSATIEAADDLVVDQENTILDTLNFYNIVGFAPIGQEFAPGLQALDFVDLSVEDASCSALNPPGIRGVVQIRLREYGISGPILASSQQFGFTNCFRDIVRFEFEPYVPVVPGRVYVIEPFHVSGNESLVAVDDGPLPNYHEGSLIFLGVPAPDKDMWFREGLANSIPGDKQQCFASGWRDLVRHDGSPFKNQGDCVQYTNTGM